MVAVEESDRRRSEEADVRYQPQSQLVTEPQILYNSEECLSIIRVSLEQPY
jgi:hypothetical protein